MHPQLFAALSWHYSCQWDLRPEASPLMNVANGLKSKLHGFQAIIQFSMTAILWGFICFFLRSASHVYFFILTVVWMKIDISSIILFYNLLWSKVICFWLECVFSIHLPLSTLLPTCMLFGARASPERQARFSCLVLYCGFMIVQVCSICACILLSISQSMRWVCNAPHSTRASPCLVALRRHPKPSWAHSSYFLVIVFYRRVLRLRGGADQSSQRFEWALRSFIVSRLVRIMLIMSIFQSSSNTTWQQMTFKFHYYWRSLCSCQCTNCKPSPDLYFAYLDFISLQAYYR